MDLYRELRQAARQLLSVPSFTLPAVLLLGLGLGAAIAMFSVVHAVLLRPMVPEQDRVVVLFPQDSSNDRPFQEISPPEFRDWRDAATSFQELAAFGAGSGTFSLLLEDGRSVDFRGVSVTPSFFEDVGQRPLLGRGFENDDELPHAEPVLVLSHGLWREAFGEDSSVLGRTLRLGARDVYTVVGVMPPGFDFPNQTRAWMVFQRGQQVDNRGWQFLLTVGRLAPGVTIEEARAEMQIADERLLEETGRVELKGRRIEVVPILEFLVADARYREIEGSRLDVYVPYLQSEIVSEALVLRTTGDPLSILPPVRAAVTDVGSELRVQNVHTMESAVDRELLPWRFQAALLSAFAASALLIATVGIFGLLAHSVSIRAREIGLRMALGARARDVLVLIVHQAMKPLFLGIGCGLFVAYLSARTVAAHLYEITPTDRATYLAVTLLVALVGLAAAYVPARRAARVDPLSVLKHE